MVAVERKAARASSMASAPLPELPVLVTEPFLDGTQLRLELRVRATGWFRSQSRADLASKCGWEYKAVFLGR